MRFNDKRKYLVGGMYQYVSDIVSYAMRNNRKLIIWGAGKGGAFLRHLICDVDGRLGVSYFIDEYAVLPCRNEKWNIFRSSILWYLEKEDYIILLSIREDKKVERMLNKLGYEKNIDYFDIRSEIGGSYLEYLEKEYREVDFAYVTKEQRPDLYDSEYYESKPFDHSSIDRVFSEIEMLPCEKRFFDIGCGKGQMLLMAAMCGMEKIGGIEFNSEIAEIARKNMTVLYIDADVLTGDATEYTEIDDYDIFFLYNPFGEKSIRKVVSNINESWKRNKRSIFLVYGNPFYHMAVMEIENVDLYRQIIVDLYDPILNIYRIGR
ncbi:MAG: class I SAM-dependent methyltransferase [Lachnospiraceae bacterium]|jgi:tRNA A58 N-methylase Trm61|nr:class I SAM-dependent methyltransferase [Lachnospiraceae bacterium]